MANITTSNRKTSSRSVVVSAAALWLMTAASASAQIIDPSTLHIGNGVTGSCPTGGCPTFNQNLNGPGSNELNQYSTQLDLYQTSGGQSTLLNDPVLLILGVPNDTATGTLTAGAVTSPKQFNPVTAATGSPLGFFTGSAFGFSFTGGFDYLGNTFNSGDIYGFLSSKSSPTDPLIAGSNNSNSFTNWQTADAHLNSINSGLTNINVTDFGVYLFAFDTTTFAANDAINVLLSGIPEGTFAVGYGESADGKPFSTPITEAGYETGGDSNGGGGGGGGPVPEPSALAVFAAALLGMAALRRRRPS